MPLKLQAHAEGPPGYKIMDTIFRPANSPSMCAARAPAPCGVRLASQGGASHRQEVGSAHTLWLASALQNRHPSATPDRIDHRPGREADNIATETNGRRVARPLAMVEDLADLAGNGGDPHVCALPTRKTLLE